MKKTILICLLILLIVIVVLHNCNSEGFANDESSQAEIIWENKLLKIEDVVKNLQNSLAECGVSNISLETSDFSVIDSRKRLIDLLPVTKLLDKVTYDQIQCFVSKFDPENYLVISKTVTTVPKILRPRNIIIVNDVLYQSTPYGVLKYKIPALAAFKGLESLNASIECGVLNDFNTFNTTSDPIFHLEGKIIQKRGKQFVDMRNNDNYEITDVNNKIEILNKKIINKLEQNKSDNVQVQNKISQENIVNSQKVKDTVTKLVEKMVDIGGLIELNIEDPKQLKVVDTQTFLPVVSTVVKAAITEEVRPIEEEIRGTVSEERKAVIAEEVRKAVGEEGRTGIVAEEVRKAITNEEAKSVVVNGKVVLAEGRVVNEEVKQAIASEEERKAVIAEEVKRAIIAEEVKSVVINEKPILSEGRIISEDVRNAIASEESKPIVLSDGTIVSAEAVKQEIKQELTSKGVPESEQDKFVAAKLVSLRVAEESRKKIVAETPIIQKSDVDISKLLDSLLSVFEYDGVIYMVEPTVIRPYSSWAIKVNETLAKSKMEIKGVIPHFFHVNGTFNYRLVLLLNDDYYIWVNKENVSKVLDIKQDWNITFNSNIPDTLPCDELKTILEQMTKANIINKDKSDFIIKNYRC